MKILVVSNMFPDEDNPSYGIFVKKFCDQLPRIGIEYDLAVMTKGKNKVDKILKYTLFYFSSFCKCLFGNYDVTYVHYTSHSSLGVLLARKIKKFTIFANMHGSDVVPESMRQNRMQKYTRDTLSKAKRIIVPSEYFRKLVSEKYCIDETLIFIYPSGGIDKSVFYEIDKKRISELRNKLGLSSELKVFGMTSRIIHNKGWDTFLDSIKIIVDKGYEANFVIVGDGNESLMLEQKIKELKLDSKVIYIKKLIPQRELAVYYSLFDWFVFPTKLHESLGLVAIEAMACGTPVIASDFAAPHYYVENGINGYKFKIGSAKDLADKIAQVIESKEKKTYFKKGLNNTVMRYSEENIIKDLKQVFCEEQ